MAFGYALLKGRGSAAGYARESIKDTAFDSASKT